MSNTILITGDTYPVKDQLKALGARWDSASRGWRVPEENSADALALVAPAAPVSQSARLSCRSCGQTGTRGAYPFSTMPGSGRCDDCC